MSVHFGFSEEKKPGLSGGKLTEDLDADNWATLNVPTPIKSHQAIPKEWRCGTTQVVFARWNVRHTSFTLEICGH